MSAPTPDDIFAFLSGEPPRPGSGADRVRAAVLDPKADPETAAALVKFRAAHKDLQNAPRARKLVDEFREELKRQLTDAAQNPPAPVPPPPPTWRPLFDRLIAHCRAEFTTARPAPPAGSAENMVSSILSSYITGSADGRYGELNDPAQLWPVLLEIAARKLNQRLTPATVSNTRFADALGEVLASAFDLAQDDRRRLIVAHALFGRTPEQVAQLTHTFEDDISAVIRTLHAELHLSL